MYGTASFWALGADIANKGFYHRKPHTNPGSYGHRVIDTTSCDAVANAKHGDAGIKEPANGDYGKDQILS